MNILIIGASSYIGGNLFQTLSGQCNLIITYCTHSLPQSNSNKNTVHLDVRDNSEVNKIILGFGPEIIYYFPFSLNDIFGTTVLGIKNVIAAVKKAGIQSKIVFLSTDNVFDGKKGMYLETDTPLPINDYGRAKCEAEKLVLDTGGQVVRTSLVYGFSPLDYRIQKIIWELNHLKRTNPYFVDEFRCPIWVDDLCTALVEIPQIDGLQLIHVAGPERFNRYEFAKKIARAFCMNEDKITANFSNIINRPKDASLNISLAKKLLKTKIKTFEQIISYKRSDIYNSEYTLVTKQESHLFKGRTH